MENRLFQRERLKDYAPIEISGLQTKPPKPSFSVFSFLVAPLCTIALYLVIFFLLMKDSGSFTLFFVVSAAVGMVLSLLRFFADRRRWKQACAQIDRENNACFSVLESRSVKNASEYQNAMEACFPRASAQANWEWIRSPGQKSYLRARIGVGQGSNPSRLVFRDQEQEKEFREVYQERIDRTAHIRELPCVLDLRAHRIIGVYGEQKLLVMNALTMNILAFHHEDHVRLAILDEGGLFEYYRRMPHANEDSYGNLYAATEQQRLALVEWLRWESRNRSVDLTIVVLGSDRLLSRREIRELSEMEGVLILALCEGTPGSFCDVTIGKSTLEYRSDPEAHCVSLDRVPQDYIRQYVRRYPLVQSESSERREMRTLPDQVDAGSFFGLTPNI